MKNTKYLDLPNSLSIVQIAVISIFAALLIDFAPDQDLDTLAVITQLISHSHLFNLFSHSFILSLGKIVLQALQNSISFISFSAIFSHAHLVKYFVIAIISIIVCLTSQNTKVFLAFLSTVFVTSLFHSKKEVIFAFRSIP